MERRDIRRMPETRAMGEGSERRIEGLGAVYYDPKDPQTEYRIFDDLVERLMPGAFDGVADQERDVVSLFNHDFNLVLGRTSNDTLSLSDSPEGYRYSTLPNPDSPDSAKVFALLERKDSRGSSIGFHVTGEEWKVEDEVTIRTITGVELYDIGPVTEPAYLATTAEARSLRERAEDFLKQEGIAARKIRQRWRDRDLEILAGMGG